MWKGKVSSGRPSSSIGRGSSSAAGLFPVGRRSGVLPVGRGSGVAAKSFNGCTASPPAGFPIHPSPSQAWWGSDGTSPASSSFLCSDPTWEAECTAIDLLKVVQASNNNPASYHPLVGQLDWPDHLFLCLMN